MCMACQEMELFYAYLDALEEEKRKAQPWQCEITIIAESDEKASPSQAGAAPVATRRTSKSGFACDEAE